MDLTPFIAAFEAHQWPLFAALIVGLIVALSKQGWLSAWLAAKLPATARPWYALVITALTTGSGDIVAGKTWQVALQDIALTFVTAVMGHQIVIESVRRGLELIPRRVTEKSATTGTYPTASLAFVFIFGSILFAGYVTACTAAQLKSGFTAVEIACEAEVLASTVIPAGTDVTIVAKDLTAACDLADADLPAVQAVILAWMASQTPPAAGSVYTPSPMVKSKKLAPHASLGAFGPLDRPRRLARALAFGA